MCSEKPFRASSIVLSKNRTQWSQQEVELWLVVLGNCPVGWAFGHSTSNRYLHCKKSVPWFYFVVTAEESQKVRQMVEEQKQNMNLNAVRLCFQAYLPDDSGCFTKALPPCISNPVYDSSELNWKEFLWPGLLIFRAVAEPRISTKSAKSHESYQNTRNPTKFARNLTEYMSAQYIWKLSWLLGLLTCCKRASLPWNFVSTAIE